MLRLLRKPDEEQFQKLLLLACARLHGNIRIQNQFDRALAEAVGHAAGCRHRSDLRVAFQPCQFHQFLLPTACGENDTRVIEPAQLRTDGTQHSNGVRLHSIKFL